ncbi:cytochrome c oxidase subunit II [Phenylobacterium sp. J426]|uniref:cytochrome c oxidase subunit II n=1 Tax=Phenylobacterium sp. J426 TaxID=2898439 RepID=UPI002151963C|nr:cytochrome c oxidase subunit II [Phenylobacterium sp. J426]MCR5873332.1 cytochrome c oxidase subunit II [Phenylobacterium sp. J426]
MKSRFQGLRALAAGLVATATGAFWSASALAEDWVGQPTPGAIDLQPGVTPLRADAIWFHNVILLPIITIITLFVLALLVWVIVRYNKRANPVPARWSHNTPIEVIWTVVPVLILMVIAVFSFRLLYAYHDMPKPDVTVKATGYQWYWGYEYPDLEVSEFVSNMLPEDQAKAKNVPFRLAATEPMVVPVGKTVRVLVTGADVIHAFAVPSFGVITDAIPGRVNETWFRADKVGTYYGNCRELCGVDHAFMPIEVRVVTQPEFDAWVASKGGGAPAPTPSALAAEANAAGAANTEAAPAAGDAAVPAAAAPVNPAAPAPATPEPKAPVAAAAAPAAAPAKK